MLKKLGWISKFFKFQFNYFTSKLLCQTPFFTSKLHLFNKLTDNIYIYVCVCVCVCWYSWIVRVTLVNLKLTSAFAQDTSKVVLISSVECLYYNCKCLSRKWNCLSLSTKLLKLQESLKQQVFNFKFST